MNNEPNFTEALHLILTMGPDEATKRLKGVQGPERHLVGDVAERIPRQDGVEEAKPGRRAVGEIVELAELRRIIDREIKKAWAVKERKTRKRPLASCAYEDGRADALDKLLTLVERIAEKRSDLSNK